MVGTITPTPAVIAGWTSDFDSGTGITFERNDSGNAWEQYPLLASLNPSWNVVGVVVRSVSGTAKSGLVGGPTNLGQCSRVYQGTLGQVVGQFPNTYDGNLTTYYGDASGQGTNNALSCIHDFGTALTVGSWMATWLATNAQTINYDLSYSTDGSAWTSAQSGSFSANGANMAAGGLLSSISARWWRFSIKQTTGASYFLRLYEFQLWTP